MAVIWRGLGIAVPIVFLVVGAALAAFYNDQSLGNLALTGRVCAITAVLLIPVAAMSFKGEKDWWVHSTFFIPVVFWVPIMAGVAALALLGHEPSIERAHGSYVADDCMDDGCEYEGWKARTIELSAERISFSTHERAYQSEAYEITGDDGNDFAITTSDGVEHRFRTGGNTRLYQLSLDPDDRVWRVAYVRAE